jgi:hypothetical protein
MREPEKLNFSSKSKDRIIFQHQIKFRQAWKLGVLKIKRAGKLKYMQSRVAHFLLR